MRYFLILVSICFFQPMVAQKWHNPLLAGFPVIQQQGWTSEIGHSYNRLPQRAKEMVRKPVWNLSQNSTGLSIHFYSNAPQITIRYTLTKNKDYAMEHMPATGVSGLDLYAIKENGDWRRATAKYHFGDTVVYSYQNLFTGKIHQKGFEYRLYLPLYNTVTWMEIGVPDGSYFEFIPILKEKPIIVYGTSIAQGGCASRPAMGWTNILARKLDYPVQNLAFSGNGPLEKELVNFIQELPAKAYIFDCLPNMGGLKDEEVYQRVWYGVTTLRKKYTTPIVLVDHIGYMNDGTDSTRGAVWRRLNAVQKRAFQDLQKQGIQNLWYLDVEALNFPEDGTVDYVHPNDLGMEAYALAYEKLLRQILLMPKGSIPTTQAVSQRREANGYEWKKRHQAFLDLQEKQPLQNIILGNSIIHYWGGQPGAHMVRSEKSWNAYLKNYRNGGFGWDRIENVLWRVYHGAIDEPALQKILVMIGTNNIGISSDEDIVLGLQHLLAQIRIRQPKAELKIAGIFPRRNTEDRIQQLNKAIQKMAAAAGIRFINPGLGLLGKDQKIDESLFSDGVHPNEKGYSKIAAGVVQ